MVIEIGRSEVKHILNLAHVACFQHVPKSSLSHCGPPMCKNDDVSNFWTFSIIFLLYYVLSSFIFLYCHKSNILTPKNIPKLLSFFWLIAREDLEILTKSSTWRKLYVYFHFLWYKIILNIHGENSRMKTK